MNAIYSGIVFDFNGTIFWDTEIHNEAWDIFFESHNIKMSDAEKFHTMHGKNNKDILISLFPKTNNNDVDRLSLEKELIYQELCLKTEMSLAPGLKDFLLFLKERNIPFTIATASGKENQDFYFKYLDLSKWFDINKVVYNNGQIKSKPDPEIYLKAMQQIGKKPEDTIIFEDAIAGLEGARNAKAGKIIIVDSFGYEYKGWDNYLKIKNYTEIDRNLFI